MCSRFLLVLFQYKFHQKGSILPSVLPFPLTAHKEHHSPLNFHFPLILLSVKLNLNFYTSHLSSILFSSLIADFIFALNYPNQLFLIYQEITLVFYFNSRQKVLYYNIYFLSIILYFRSKKLLFSPYSTRVLDFQSRIYVPPKPDIRAAQTGYKCH